MIGKWLAASLAAVLLSSPAATQEFKAGGITVSTPWARATPGGAKVGGAFLTISAVQGAGDQLVAVKSPVAGTVEIHDHIEEKGVMKMRRVDGVKVTGGQSVTFRPGGYHLMLMDLKQPLKQGEKLPLTLVFEKAGEIGIEALVAAIGAAGPTGGNATGPAATKAGPAKGGGHKH